ncbi:MAG: hypothetical protein IT576_09310 [Verrucomicrobiales bacterium]|nr:hypothetical protein [Verrucomicrobiales bacterium]
MRTITLNGHSIPYISENGRYYFRATYVATWLGYTGISAIKAHCFEYETIYSETDSAPIGGNHQKQAFVSLGDLFTLIWKSDKLDQNERIRISRELANSALR